MFVRFRQTARRARLQVSLIETRRADGRVRHEHVASLGSVASQPGVIDRVKFWDAAEVRLARMQNRLGAAELAAIRAKIAERVPLTSQQEQANVAAVLAMSPVERRHCIRVAEVWDALGDEAMRVIIAAMQADNRKRERRELDALHRVACRPSGAGTSQLA